jgi:hypothetical protein
MKVEINIKGEIKNDHYKKIENSITHIKSLFIWCKVVKNIEEYEGEKP